MRNRFITMAVALTFFTLFSAASSSASVEFGATRSFEFTYIAQVRDVPSGAGKLNMWIPYITSNDDQLVTDVKVDSPYPVTINYDQKWGNAIAFLSVPNPGSKGFDIKITYKVVRKERKTSGFDYESNLDTKDSGQFQRYLLPSRYAIVNDTVAQFSNAATAGRKNSLDKARGAYEYILSKMEYNKKIPGWGKGDVNRVCLAIDGGKSGTGNCTDFHSFFGSLMRVQGIPVMFEMGYPLKPDKSQTEPKAGGYHCWAKFFVPGYGWIPVDISEARKDMSKKEYFWGAICENRVKFSHGRDITLVPAQEGEPLNYFGPDPYIEVDGKAFSGFKRLIAYKNI